MYNFLLRFLTIMAALFLSDYLLAGVSVDSIYTAIIAALILGVLNLLVRPILIVLTLPITILTFGLFLLVLNASLFWFVGSFVEGFEVDGFLAACAGALIVSITNWFIHKLT